MSRAIKIVTCVECKYAEWGMQDNGVNWSQVILDCECGHLSESMAQEEVEKFFCADGEVNNV